MSIVKDKNNNIIYGAEYINNSTEVNFVGKNNILFLEGNVKLKESVFNFLGNDSVVYIKGSRSTLCICVDLYNQCTFSLGKDNYLNDKLSVIISEQTSVSIGDECAISFGVWIRTADPHLIYNKLDHKRINPSKSVIIGDHAWIGQDSKILKGSYVGSGSIIGAGAVVSGKKIPSNTIYAGNPVKQIKKDIFWDGACVHAWTNIETEKHEEFESDKWIYTGNEKTIKLASIERKLKNASNSEERLKIIQKLHKKDNHRFYIPPIDTKKRYIKRIKRKIKKLIKKR